MRTPIALMLLAIAASAPAQGYKAVKRWVGGCDNTRHCAAIGFAPEDSAAYAMLHFERGGNGGDRVPRITLRSDNGFEKGRAHALRADDAELLRFTDAHLESSESGAGVDIVISAADEIAAIFGALRGADLLTVVTDGEPAAVVSASGASAILLWMDEQQQRLGTQGAFVRKGDRPDASVPTPPPPPMVKATPGGNTLDEVESHRLGKLIRETLEAEACEELNPDIGMADSAFELADGRMLAALTCFPGAYNFGSRWFLLAQGKPPQPLAFPVPDEDGSGRMESIEDLINASFDPATGELGSFNKGRGISDCGTAASWVWDGQGFQLAEYRTMNDCQGVTPDFWPRLWRTR